MQCLSVLLIAIVAAAMNVSGLSITGKACPAGFELVGVRCLPCPKNHYAKAGDTDGCKPCPAGSMSGHPADHCFQCPYNMYNPTKGSGCLDCPKGSYTLQMGATECTTCTKRTLVKYPEAYWCGLYMVCEPGKDVEVDRCPTGTCFDETLGRCADSVVVGVREADTR